MLHLSCMWFHLFFEISQIEICIIFSALTDIWLVLTCLFCHTWRYLGMTTDSSLVQSNLALACTVGTQQHLECFLAHSLKTYTLFKRQRLHPFDHFVWGNSNFEKCLLWVPLQFMVLKLYMMKAMEKFYKGLKERQSIIQILAMLSGLGVGVGAVAPMKYSRGLRVK